MSGNGFDLDAIRQGLAAAVDQVPLIKRAYPEIVDHLEDAPAAYVGNADPADYNQTFARGATQATIPVVLVAGRVDVVQSQQDLNKLISWPHPGDDDGNSVKAYIESDRTLGGAVDTCQVRRAHYLRAVTIGETDYLAIDLEVVVQTSARRRPATPDPTDS